MSRIFVAAAVLGSAPTAAPLHGQRTLDDFAAREIGDMSPGFSLALIHQGRVQLNRSWGETAPGSGEPLDGDELYPFPELVPVMLGAVAAGLDRNGAVPLDRPLGEMLEGVPSGAADVTVRQLITRTSGLDDARPRPDRDWDGQIRLLTSRARTAPPAAFYSTSRYELPLLAYALEEILDLPVEEILRQAVLEPLGMERSTLEPPTDPVPGFQWSPETGLVPVAGVPAPVDGLPMLYTTPTDVAAFWSALLGGTLPLDPGGLVPDVPPQRRRGRAWVAGIDVERTTGSRIRYRVPYSNEGYWAEVYAFPISGTGAVVMGTGRRAALTASGAMGILASLLPEQPADTPLQKAVPPATPFPDIPAETWSRWAGTYRNGDRLVVLRYLDGQLHYWDGAESLPMVQDESGWWVLDHDTAAFEPLLLLEEMGERWVFFRETIHAWDPDSAPEIPPGG